MLFIGVLLCNALRLCTALLSMPTLDVWVDLDYSKTLMDSARGMAVLLTPYEVGGRK
jgi:hypothetical protein